MNNTDLFTNDEDIFNTQESTEVIEETNVTDDNRFINGLPSWDLLPPYETVNRVNRS